MEIIRASKMGFCFGVQEAVKVCYDILSDPKNKNKKKYIYGMLIHNEYVMEKLEKRGFNVILEPDLDALEQGDILVIRAHGVSKDIYEKLKDKQIELYDATCIFVSRIRIKVEEASKQGFDILFIGDENHPEVKGIVSFAKNIQIFQTLENLKEAKLDENKRYFLSTQTTLNKNKFKEIKNYLENRYKNIKIFDKICGATQERQASVEKLALETDVLIIVGGKKSSNTKKLFEISKALNENSYLIQDVDEVDFEWFVGKKRIGLTAGASTPEEIIIDIENKIRGNIDAKY